MRRRLRVGVLFGGRSGEHEVSLRSARFVLDSLDPHKYEAVPIGIAKDGEWLLTADPMRQLTGGADEASVEHDARLPVTLPTSAIEPGRVAGSVGRLDVVFPVLHGTYGEDGTVQGLFELARIPYVGSGVAGSAVAMDKGLANAVLRSEGLPKADWLVLPREEWQRDPEGTRSRIESRFGYPVFVKPCNLGSSVGITKVHGPEELGAALDRGGEYDRRLLVEQAVPSARDIEVGVLGNYAPEASVCGEIIPGNEFYDYSAKYINGTSREVIPADLPADAAERIRSMAVRAFLAVDAAGYARVDFLVNGETLEVFLSEINTIPGFTSISMFPKLWAASGLGHRELLDRLIELALEHHAERQGLRTSYT